MEGPAAVGVDDPVEDYGEEKEGEGVEDFVVDVGSDLEGGEAGVACEEEQQEEDSCRAVSVCLRLAGRAFCLGSVEAPGWWSGVGAWELSFQLLTNLRTEVVSSYLGAFLFRRTNHE